MQSIIVFIDEDKGEIMPAGQKKNQTWKNTNLSA